MVVQQSCVTLLQNPFHLTALFWSSCRSHDTPSAHSEYIKLNQTMSVLKHFHWLCKPGKSLPADLKQTVHLNLAPLTHLPGVIRLQLDGGQCGQAGYKAHPFALDKGDTVEYDAVRQNQSHEGPAHRDQDCQTTVHTKDQGSVLWVKRDQRQCDVMEGFLYYSEFIATHMKSAVSTITLLYLQQ